MNGENCISSRRRPSLPFTTTMRLGNLKFPNTTTGDSKRATTQSSLLSTPITVSLAPTCVPEPPNKQLHRSRSYSNLKSAESLSDDEKVSFSLVNQQVKTPASSPPLPEGIEGYMLLKSRKQHHSILFSNSKRKYYIQIIPAKHELLIFNDKHKTITSYALSLIGADVAFEPNKSMAVTEHCFRLSVKCWRDKKTLHETPNSFLFYDNKQISFYKWIKVITSVIKHASTSDTSLKDFHTASVRLGLRRDSIENRSSSSEDEEEEDVQVITTYDLPHLLDQERTRTLSKSFSLDRIVTIEKPREKPKVKKTSLIIRAKHKLNNRSEAFKKAIGKKGHRQHHENPDSKAVVAHAIVENDVRAERVTTSSSFVVARAKQVNEKEFRENATRLILVTLMLFYQNATPISVILFSIAFTAIEFLSSSSDLHLKFLRYLVIGSFNNTYDTFVTTLVFILYTSHSAYVANREFSKRERRCQVELLREMERSDGYQDFKSLPSWLTCPENISRVSWLNTVLEILWPHIKVALRDSLLYWITPLMVENKPAYLATLEFGELDLGDSYPVIEGVRVLSHERSQVVLDLDLQYAASDDQLAEVRLTSTVGGTAKIKLRELSITGTLRLYFTPLCNEWPCFSSISIAFVR